MPVSGYVELSLGEVSQGGSSRQRKGTDHILERCHIVRCAETSRSYNWGMRGMLVVHGKARDEPDRVRRQPLAKLARLQVRPI